MALTRPMHTAHHDGTASARRAPGLAALPLDAVVPLAGASSADPIVLLVLRNKGAPVCSDPGQQSSACPGTKGRDRGGECGD
ncbi:hypothetical protein VZT92_023417 [Zoarces viviparus]|uniref:Uncharacterized protein n=1 Tax=Zoarces viviparus TaxID=48416 RepID=A0AAW1E6B7_ZOAVI